MKSKIEFGLLTDYRVEEDGQMSTIALFVVRHMRRASIASKNADLLDDYGGKLMTWTGNNDLRPDNCGYSDMVHDWWTVLDQAPSVSKEGVCLLIMLVCWKIWKGRNASVFEREELTNAGVLQKINDEACCMPVGRDGSKAP